MPAKKQLTEQQRAQMRSVLRWMLDVKDASGRRVWSQARLGDVLGFSQETVRRGLEGEGGERVHEALDEALRRFLGQPLDTVTQGDIARVWSTRIDPAEPDMYEHAIQQQEQRLSERERAQRYTYAEQVVDRLVQRKGLSRSEAGRIVGAIAFDEGHAGSTLLDLYDLALEALAEERGRAVGQRDLGDDV